MKRLSLPILLSLLACLSLPAWASELPSPKEAHLSGPDFRTTPEAPHLSVMRRPSGEPILVVNYPWQRHERPSIEMRLLEKKDREPSAWKPIFFVTNFLTEDAIKAVHHCLDQGENLPATATFTNYKSKQEVKFEVTGQRNALNRSSVVIHGLSELEGPRGGSRLIFWPLKDWALDRATLWLELPKKDAPKPCRICVWFLRHDDIVWAETLAWPGYPEQSPAPPRGPKEPENPRPEVENP